MYYHQANEPQLEIYRQIPNPSDKDRRVPGRGANNGSTATGPTAITVTNGGAAATTPDSNPNQMQISTQQAMEMLQQLLVRESVTDDAPAAADPLPAAVVPQAIQASAATAPSPAVAVAPAATTAALVPTPALAPVTQSDDRPMVCNLKDHR